MDYSVEVTKKERAEFFRKLAAKGGKNRAKNLTARQRSNAARKAARARWAKKEEN